MFRFRLISFVVAAALLAACNRNAEPEVRLEPTRTVAPRATEAPEAASTLSVGGSSSTANATAAPASAPKPITGLTADNAAQLGPIFTLNEPPPQHIYSVADDRLTLYNARNFESVDPRSLDSTTRTDVQLRDPAGQGYWYAASPNGKVGAIMQLDGTLDIYDLETGKVAQTLKVPEPSFEVASDIALNDDGSEIVVIAQGELRRITIADGKIVGEGQTLPDATSTLRFSEDASRVVAVQATGELVIVNALTGATPITITEVFSTGSVVNLSLSPNGRKLGVASANELVVWDVGEDAATRQQEFSDLNSAVDTVFDRTGKYMAIIAGPSVYLYDLEKQEGLNEFRLTGSVPIWTANFDPKSETLFIAGSGELASFRVSDGEPLQATARPPLTRGAFSPDGRTLATWSTTFASPNVAVVDTTSGAISNRLIHRAPLRWVSYSSSGKYIATLTLANSVHIWNARTGDETIRVSAPNTDTLRALLCFNTDETSVAYLEDQQVILQSTDRENNATSFDLPFQPVALTTCANDKRYIAAASNTVIEVLNLKGDRVARITENVDFNDTGALYFNQTGTRLAALSLTQLVVWDVATQKELQRIRLQREPMMGSFNPDGSKFALNFGDDVDVIDVTTGKAVSLDIPKGSTVNVLFPQDPNVIATAIQLPSDATAAEPIEQRNFVSGELTVWDANTGKVIHAIEVEAPILTAEISDDGKTIATSTRLNSLTVWGLK
jgi:WD40 repeat protein